MPTAFQKARRILFIVYLVALHTVVIYFVGERILRRYVAVEPVDEASVPVATEKTEIPTPLPVPETFADATPANVNTNTETSAPSPATTQSPGLMIPVVGIRPDQLTDTFTASRSAGRSHDAIDIMAPGGTPVVAAADGEIVKFFDSERGGITIYELTADKKYMLYYAHLQRRADDVSVGMQVKKGATIGFVGDTGNAGAGNTHLHFSVAIVTDPKRFWEGVYLNPYPLLKNGEYPR
jgi:murein DD-endopeptidase MepM/ murein hydrolase activator NlpD